MKSSPFLWMPAFAILLVACDDGPTQTTRSIDLTGRWLGTVTQPGGPWADIFEYRLTITHSGAQVTGTATSRWLVEPQHFADFTLTGSFSPLGGIALHEGGLLSETKPSDGTFWCPKQLTLTYSPQDGGTLAGNWTSQSCLPGSVSLQRDGRSTTVWPIASGNGAQGFDGPCDDWPGHATGCYWLSQNGWRDAQPFRRHFNPAYNGYHLGADWNLGTNADDKDMPIHAMADGTVSSVQHSVPGWGNVIFVLHRLPIGTFTSMYAHVAWNSSGPPAEGTSVSRGQQVARVGNGNNLYPYHLHFEVRAGNSTRIASGYVTAPSGRTPENQVNPNIFVRSFR